MLRHSIHKHSVTSRIRTHVRAIIFEGVGSVQPCLPSNQCKVRTRCTRDARYTMHTAQTMYTMYDAYNADTNYICSVLLSPIGPPQEI